ncbi:MAG: alpha/beta fold hydrolase [Myxococcales bacterium]|nr:alpha/beta fold hydrolase [Myxococcales bacterium]
MRGARTIAGALVFADLLVGGCGGTGSTSDAGDADEAQRGDGGTSGASAGWMEHDCRMQIPDGLNADDYRCGTLMVDGEGGDELLSIEVAVLEASADTPAPDPLVFVGGGPGSASLDGYLQTHSAAVLSPIREARDIVFFDQRGSGRATPSLECPEVVDATVASLSRDDSPEEEGTAVLDAYEDCRERLEREGVALRGYHGAAVARDIDALMAALGYERFNLYGISYGGRIAQVMLRDRPQRVRSAILDASVLPAGNIATDSARNVSDALEALFSDCLAAGSCDAELPERLYQAQAQLDETPHAVDVIGDARITTVVVNGHRALLLLRGLLSPERSGSVPSVIDQWVEGGYGLLDLAAPRLVPQPGRATHGFYATVLCAEEVPFETDESLARGVEGIRPELVQAMAPGGGEFNLELCRRWDVDARPAIENEAITSDVPVLILHGSYDASVHPGSSSRAHESFANSQHILFDGYGHGVLRSLPGSAEEPSCPQRLVAEFLDDPMATLDASCAASSASEP